MQTNRHIADLAAVFTGAGIKHVVICPGSRNAPLIQLFTGLSYFSCHSVVDERSAAYIALGMARETGRPAAVVTTSGTAVMNLAPAAAEAYHQGIPLVLLTADRPLERFATFNNQWIDQEAPFYNCSKGFLQLEPDPREDGIVKPAAGSMEQLLAEAISYPPGPVHINVLLEEPLYERLPENTERDAVPAKLPESSDPVETGELPAPGERVLLLAGMGALQTVSEKVFSALARREGTVVVAENIANLGGDRVIRYPELSLRAAGKDLLGKMKPDRILAVGGQVVSKKLKLFLQSLPGVKYRQLGSEAGAYLESWAREAPGGSHIRPFREAWFTAEQRGTGRAFPLLEELPFSNLRVVARVLEAAPKGAVIHLGNSATIRYSQLVPCRDDLTYYSNRGTSGIDGCVSSAVGAAMVSGRTHLLVLGDLAFVYDSNALWNKDFPPNLRVVVLNDSGGGIFRLLDGPSEMPFYEEFSVTHHPVSLELLGEAFGRSVLRVSSERELSGSLDAFLEPSSPHAIMESDTAGSENSLIFRQFLKDTEQHSP